MILNFDSLRSLLYGQHNQGNWQIFTKVKVYSKHAHHGRWGSDEKCCWFQPCSPSSNLPEPAGESRPRSWSLSTSCHGGWMRAGNSLCPHLKITSLLHSVSTSSLLFLVPLHRIDGRPLVWCALYHVGTGPRCKHIVRRSSWCWSESGWQGRPGYLQENILLFRFLVSISMGHL